jgi:hypothetical protein
MEKGEGEGGKRVGKNVGEGAVASKLRILVFLVEMK